MYSCLTLATPGYLPNSLTITLVSYPCTVDCVILDFWQASFAQLGSGTLQHVNSELQTAEAAPGNRRNDSCRQGDGQGNRELVTRATPVLLDVPQNPDELRIEFRGHGTRWSTSVEMAHFWLELDSNPKDHGCALYCTAEGAIISVFPSHPPFAW